MNSHQKTALFSAWVVLLPIAATYGQPYAMGTAFTYQGQLKEGGDPVTDTCDFEFALWNDPDSIDPGDQVGDTQTPTDVDVADGLFAVLLDFGSGAFQGDARWLEMGVKCPGDADFTPLSPRQEVTPAPYSLHAASVSPAVLADLDGDGVPNASDNCPFTANPGQEDMDNDAIGDACDNCPGVFNPWQIDTDHDGVGDDCDNCVTDYNPNQTDTDSDTWGDACDCGPADATAYPGAPEICDTVDNNCDGDADEGEDNPGCFAHCPDVDGDGYGDESDTKCLCHAQGSYHNTVCTDCDDLDGYIYPGASEVVGDGIDQDCDGVDDCYQDLDGDTYGSAIVITDNNLNCDDASTANTASTGGDCDDSVPGINPGAPEVVADGIDQDCDGGDDCYQDLDGDMYGSAIVITDNNLNCDDASTPNTAGTSGDCDDSDATIYPGATEVVADGIDQDCDGADHCYQDLDSDTYGSSIVIMDDNLDCLDASTPYTAGMSGDCDDSSALVNPGIAETWTAGNCFDALDNDCDGDTDANDSGCWYCPNGNCDPGETTCNCWQDCGTSCGDGCCSSPIENTCNCWPDCGTACGDGCCNGGENTCNCCNDCGSNCGDGCCNCSENWLTCPADC